MTGITLGQSHICTASLDSPAILLRRHHHLECTVEETEAKPGEEVRTVAEKVMPVPSITPAAAPTLHLAKRSPGARTEVIRAISFVG